MFLASSPLKAAEMLDDIEQLQELDLRRAQQKSSNPYENQNSSYGQNEIQPVDAKTYLIAYERGPYTNTKKKWPKRAKHKARKSYKGSIKPRLTKIKSANSSQFKGVDAESFLRVYDRHFGFQKKNSQPVDAQRYLDYYNEKMSQKVLRGILTQKKKSKKLAGRKMPPALRKTSKPPAEDETDFYPEGNIETDSSVAQEEVVNEEADEDIDPSEEE